MRTTQFLIDHAPRINAQRAADAAVQKKLNNNAYCDRQASFCVDWLEAQGFVVLNVERGPRITVCYSPLCDRLEGAVQGYSSGIKGCQRYKMVWRFDCQVRWAEAQLEP